MNHIVVLYMQNTAVNQMHHEWKPCCSMYALNHCRDLRTQVTKCRRKEILFKN